MDVDFRGKFGCHHISLYVEKYEKANRILILSKTVKCNRSKFFFFILSSDSISSYLPLKKCLICFLLFLKLSFCFGSYFWKMILWKSWNLFMSLIRRRAKPGHFLVFESTCLSPYAFPGMEHQETSVGFTFLTIPRLGKRQFCISEIFSVNAYTNVQCHPFMPKTPESEVIICSWKQKLVRVSRTGRIS